MTKKNSNILILIVDDNPINIQLLKNILKNNNFKVASAFNGKTALNFIRKKKPDLVLLDIMMPQMDGFAVLEKLKKSVKTLSVPVIMLSARGDEESKIQAAGSYNEDYIVKPVQIEFLKSKIEEALDRRSN